MVFDNATGAAHRVAWDRIRVVKVFQLFCEHHRIEVRFCNPSSGWEKGSVENAVGFLRRNLMVPPPNAESHRQLTRHLLSGCDAIADVDHYRSGRTIRDMFADDLEDMLPLPEPGSTPSNGLSAGRTGRVTSRSTPTATSRARRGAGGRCRSAWRAFDVEIRTRDGRKVNTLPRVYGRCGRTVRNPACLLPALARKPRAWGESPIRGDFPGKLRLRIDAMDSGIGNARSV